MADPNFAKPTVRLSAPVRCLSGLSVGLLLAVGLLQPAAASQPRLPLPAALQNLVKGLSPEIQATLTACQSAGGVDLATATSQADPVRCSNGASVENLSYQSYVDTTSSFLAASSLVGLRAAIVSNPQIRPEQLIAALESPDGAAALQNAIAAAIHRTGLVAGAPESSGRLTQAVVGRLLPTIAATDNLQTLLGTTEQYRQVVSRFCTAPGMSVAEAQQSLPGLSPIQLYAICVQESGLADQVMQLAR